MDYGIRELSELAGVSARTLRYYDQIGLLKPLYVSEAGYRYYGQHEVALLQQILFYRERGFELKQIQKILYQDNFDITGALKEHLLGLEKQRVHMDMLIRTVRQTLLSMKGEYEMSDKEKFEAFKENLIKENEEKYGEEIRERFGAEEVEESNRKLRGMSPEEWRNMEKLELEIGELLKESVLSKEVPESEAAEKIVSLHKQWLCCNWKEYTPQAHKGLARAYVADERFRGYYDQEMDGCAEFLEKAIQYWADRI